MQEKFAILGQGIVGPFGVGPSELKVRVAEQFKLEVSAGSPFPITSAETLESALPKAGIRRTDHFSRLAMAAASKALKSAGDAVDTENMGLIIGTGYGAVSSTCKFKDTFVNKTSLGASPTQFTKSVHNQACSQLAMLLKIHGSVTTVCQHYFPFQTALQLACLWLEEGLSETVLVGGVDEYPEHLHYCRTRLLDENGASDHPLGGVNNPGEGAAFFLLGKEHSSSQATPILSKVAFIGTKDLKNNVESCDLLVSRTKGDSSFGTTPKSNLDFHSLFGSFPTASALDCAGATLIADKDSKLCVVESQKESACLVEIIGGES